MLRVVLRGRQAKSPPCLSPRAGKTRVGHPSCYSSSSFARGLGKFARDDSRAFFDRDDLIDWNVCQAINLSAGPGDFQGIDFGALAQPELDPRVIGGHITHTALG